MRELSVHILTPGKHNPRLADIRRAVNRGSLTDDGLLPVEGPKLIQEAEESGLEIDSLFIRTDVEPDGLKTNAKVYVLDQPSFRRIQSTEHSQGVIALVRTKKSTVTGIAANAGSGPIVVLARLQDPGNAGTIIRVAESFGASGCIGLAETVALYNPKVVRASAGSIFRLPCAWEIELEQLSAILKQSGVSIVGTAPRAKDGITSWDWRRPTAVLLGNEGSGLRDDELQCCDTLLRIPLRQTVESLNSAIAASVILYESSKQRGMQ